MKKIFKRISAVLLSGMMVAALVGCGSQKEEKAVLRCKQEKQGYAVEMVFDAKGDEATRLTQISTLDLSELPQEAVDSVDASLKQMEDTYKDMKGVDYSYKKEENKIVETIVIDLSEETIQSMTESGLLPIQSNSDKPVKMISIKQSRESLKSNGWTIEE